MAVPRVLLEPDNTTFAAKVISACTVIEAAMKRGVHQGIIALSEMTLVSVLRKAAKAVAAPAGRSP